MTDTASPAVNPALLVALGVVAGLALLWFFVVSPLLTADEPEVVAPPPETPTDPDDLVAPDPDAEPVPETFEVFAARDPFQQLVTPPETPEEPEVPGEPVDPTVTPVPTPAPDPTPTPAPAPPEQEVNGEQLRLLEVATGDDGVTRAVITVDGARHTAAEGETFAGRYLVRDISDRCVTVVSGEESAVLCRPAPAPDDVAVGAATVRLVDVFTDDGVRKVLVTVNGTGYEVAEGEVFARRFRLLDISDECATFLFGDNRFTLCKGEQIRK